MKQGSWRLETLARALGARLEGDPECLITGLATLEHATASDLSFLANPRYRSQLRGTGAGAVLLAEAHLADCPTSALVMDNPYLGYARISHWFADDPGQAFGIHPTAIVDPSASLAPGVSVGAGAVIEADVSLGPDVIVGPQTLIQSGCRVGAATRLMGRVTLYPGVRIGERCLIHSGAVLGADGFGFAPDGEGGWQKIAQLGGVRIGDDVEIGACSLVDRGALEDTCIGNGVKLDNQVQVGHNVCIGDHTLIAAGTGIAGSTRIGCHCLIGGASGIGGHLRIADGVQLTGMSMVTRSLTEPGTYSSGTGVEPNRQWRRNVVRFRQLDDLARRVRELEKKQDE